MRGNELVDLARYESQIFTVAFEQSNDALTLITGRFQFFCSDYVWVMFNKVNAEFANLLPSAEWALMIRSIVACQHATATTVDGRFAMCFIHGYSLAMFCLRRYIGNRLGRGTRLEGES